MKRIPYRQNPTIIDLSKKARPPPGGGNYAYLYELSNHLNTAYNTFALARFLRTGAFYFHKCISPIAISSVCKITKKYSPWFYKTNSLLNRLPCKRFKQPHHYLLIPHFCFTALMKNIIMLTVKIWLLEPLYPSLKFSLLPSPVLPLISLFP